MFPTYWDQFRDHMDLSNISSGIHTASDGHALRTFELGNPDAPPVVVLNPLATSFLLLLPIARRLAERYRVISWETRGGPFLDEDRGSRDVTAQRRSRDIEDVLGKLGIERFHVVAWCSGMSVPMMANKALVQRLISTVMIAPLCISSSEFPTVFQTQFIPTLLRIAEDDSDNVAPLIGLVRESSERGHRNNQSSWILQALTSLSLRSDGSIRKFAKLMRDAEDMHSQTEDLRARRAEIFAGMEAQTPTLLLHCRDDRPVDYRSTLEAAVRSRNAKLTLYANGGHFFPFSNPEPMYRDIASFLREHSPG